MADNTPRPATYQVLAHMGWTKTLPDFEHVITDAKGNKQTVRQTVRLEFILAKAELQSPVTFWVSLQNSQASPGTLIVDDSNARYWFQDRLTVTMHLAPPAQPGGNRDALLTDMQLVASGPETHNGSGSVSSSVSFSFSPSFSGGFFDNLLTGNAGGGASLSETHSFSHSFQDFETSNDSDGKVAKHVYSMEMTLGGRYNEPDDLFDAHSVSGIFTAFFGGHKLYELPKLAKNDLPLVNQAVWQADHNNNITQDGELVLEIKQRLGACEQRHVPTPFATSGPTSNTITITTTIRETIPFAELTKQATADRF